jgi:lysozyme
MRGIDVSHYQYPIDWRRVHESGVQHVCIKWSEVSVDRRAPEYLRDLEAYRPDPRATVIDPPGVGLYHLWRPHLGDGQIDSIVQAYDERPWLYWPPALDLETRRLREATGEQLESLPDVLARMATPRLPGSVTVYLSARGAKILRTAGVWADIWRAVPCTLLWLCDRARYPRDLDGAPPWSWWQCSSTGSVPGIDGRVDMDLVSPSVL